MNYKSMDFVSFFSMVMGAIAVLGLAAVTLGPWGPAPPTGPPGPYLRLGHALDDRHHCEVGGALLTGRPIRSLPCSATRRARPAVC